MKKLKVMTVVGTRPEIIRLSRVIVACDKHFQHILVHTGQNYDYELNEVFFHDLGIRKPDYFLNAAGKTSSATIGNVIIAVDQLLEETQPEALLVLGDTNSCLAVLPAKRRKIPTFHMEAGNRCFDMRVPEEINRRIVDHTADINLTYSTIARDYLLAEGLNPDLIIKTGSPMFEVLHFYHERIKHSKILDKLGLTPFQYFVVSAHREENINSEPHFLDLIHTLNAVAKKYQYPVIVSTHPRTRKRIEELNITFHPLIQLLKPLGFLDYNKLQLMAKATLSDSGTINEESSILNFPALNLRQAHERPEGMEEAAVMLVGLQAERVLQGLAILDEQRRGQERDLRLVADYSMPNVSAKVIRILLSYTDYVNRVIWKKY
ncbi:UDP-N-acetylglucosamine 2-epimerase (non-hydrolyzing) [Pasteurella multocida]|uniref:UDP-N-acetylglucosamine 2-epimerase (Non-hydrolyzing) n=1 Tax=Pasteurella multocida TaxID=747 RepID=A0AAW8V790_PASMD|nr:UDP-N-acetylglucosamine 2-epimerase (non-hydrolyzing) [Pasteurella multocida]MDH7436583.1 UDP-N-acetylglucosamine 2-epimerase (non-hydrolyzing) [Pasteurella multocida]MDH7439616.1 UDP-N-acetylglucosamine 2-epimerase (non-hydrolyzing) [Pasteurella multocida]MDT3452453.1 UDP-N-acetylglucosamine 2-epimerase (non-hydrolyzing) [Pasteurella multocida]MDY0432651.1 UDP-N-acetylglucosamine 2-epimerase (non-hydrolyzing) [Pasteurella multocida]MDY0436680.1 UDP-N-acetylglucosamine 2-epimerase (non-hydr